MKKSVNLEGFLSPELDLPSLAGKLDLASLSSIALADRVEVGSIKNYEKVLAVLAVKTAALYSAMGEISPELYPQPSQHGWSEERFKTFVIAPGEYNAYDLGGNLPSMEQLGLEKKLEPFENSLYLLADARRRVLESLVEDCLVEEPLETPPFLTFSLLKSATHGIAGHVAGYLETHPDQNDLYGGEAKCCVDYFTSQALRLANEIMAERKREAVRQERNALLGDLLPALKKAPAAAPATEAAVEAERVHTA